LNPGRRELLSPASRAESPILPDLSLSLQPQNRKLLEKQIERRLRVPNSESAVDLEPPNSPPLKNNISPPVLTWNEKFESHLHFQIPTPNSNYSGTN
jgi:hypothetical protein